MTDTETVNNIQDCTIETRSIIDMLIKLTENDDAIPAYYSQAMTLLDEKYNKLENILRKL